MDHPRINCWQDLADFGIEALTGESCAIGMRHLCDLNERGARIVRALFGLPADATLAENWNARSRIGAHVASVKLPTDLMAQLAVFCLFDAGCAHVIVTRRFGVYGVREPRLDAPGGAWDTVADFRRLYGADEIDRTYTPIGGGDRPAVGLDAVHAMSGRVT